MRSGILTYAMVGYKRWMYTVANQAGTMRVFEQMEDSDVPEDILALQNKVVEQGHLAAAVPVRGKREEGEKQKG